MVLSLRDSTAGVPFELVLILARVSEHMHRKVYNEITYPFPNFNCAMVQPLKVQMDK